MCLCKIVVLRYHCLKKDTWTPPRQYSISSTALPASCPLLCLAHIASRRTQYASKHWHSGTACRALWAVLQPFLHACFTLYLRAMLACFLFRAVLVLLIGRGWASREKFAGLHENTHVARQTSPYTCTISNQRDPRQFHAQSRVRKHVTIRPCSPLSPTRTPALSSAVLSLAAVLLR